MLQDRYRQLLTAYVDGELSSRQRRHVSRLLSRSAEARQLLQQLQADARALRRLPRPSLPADLTGPILRSIAERRLTPGQCRANSTSSASSWMAPLGTWAAAAAVLILLGASSYLYFASSRPQASKTDVAQKQLVPPTVLSKPKKGTSPSVKSDTPQVVSREQPGSTIDQTSNAKSPVTVKEGRDKNVPVVPEKAPSQVKEETALTDRLEMFQLDRAPDILPVVVKVNDLDQASVRKQLKAELRKDSDYRLELPCQNGTKAFERVQKAAQTLHFGLILDKQAQERIKMKWRTNYVLYVENITPDELIRFVQQIGAEDRKSSAGKPAEIRIDRLVLTRMTPQHRKELSTLLGIDPTATPPRSTDAPAPDPRKPLADLTARQVENALAGQGGTPRPESGKPAAKPPEHYVLVLPYNPVRPTPGSEEIKLFLEKRKSTRAGTIRVLLVLRG